MRSRSQSNRNTERSRRRRNAGRRLRLESLEKRQLLATLTVNSTDDANDLNAGDGVCEISSGGACTLRAAIQEANSNAVVDQINLPEGLFVLTISGTGNLAGDLDITQSLVIQGAGAANTIIDGGGLDRVFDIANGTVVIRGVTIRGGSVEDDESLLDGSGGGIRNEGDLTLVESVITGNVATVGAGVANYNGTIAIQRSQITGNGNSITMMGGGVSNESNYDSASLQISDSTVSGNVALQGGGISNFANDGVASATISRSTISGNTATSGGGIFNRGAYIYESGVSARLTVRGSTISGNVAASDGGGIHNETNDGSTAIVDIANATIVNNTATSGDGGGVHTLDSTGTSTILTSVILSGNAAGTTGPDLATGSANASFTLIESPLGHSISDGVNQNIVGQDPLLGLLADNGGTTLTHALQSGSPAVDQGSNPFPLVGEQRGSAFDRTIDDGSIANADDGTDIGAIEIGQLAATDDFGDAPDGVSVGGVSRAYPSKLASDGARHGIVSGGPKLGIVGPDAERDATPTDSATGDDLIGFDDEDAFGSTSIVLTPGQSLEGLSVAHDGGASGAFLNLWIDLNLDGDWNDVGEQVIRDLAVPAGDSATSLASVTIPASTPAGTTFIRARISTQTGLTTLGAAVDGEVEDFVATVGTPPPAVADLSLSQVVDDNQPGLSQQVAFTITVTNAGPDRATGVDVTALLPDDLFFVRSQTSTGSYDDFDGVWFLGVLEAGATARLVVTATVETTDSVSLTAEITGADQIDPDSTPGNGISGEDDQATVALGTCLVGGPLSVGLNRLTYSCATPGAFTAFVRGTERGSFTFDQYRTTVDIADATEMAIGIANSDGIAETLFRITEEELGQPLIVQAFEMFPGTDKTNTLSLSSTVAMLRAASIGRGGMRLQPEVLSPLISAAITLWSDAGVPAKTLARLQTVPVSITDLPGDAVARVVGRTIVLDDDAAGNEWFVDGSPRDSTEYGIDSVSRLATDGSASERIDLLTTLTHEFGHLLGLPDLSFPGNVMNGVIDVGVRRLPSSNTNPTQRLDVNRDSNVTSLDALLIINRLNEDTGNNATANAFWVGDNGSSQAYFDTNADYRISALDALLIINHLATVAEAEAEAESREDVVASIDAYHRRSINPLLPISQARDEDNQDWDLYPRGW